MRRQQACQQESPPFQPAPMSGSSLADISKLPLVAVSGSLLPGKDCKILISRPDVRSPARHPQACAMLGSCHSLGWEPRAVLQAPERQHLASSVWEGPVPHSEHAAAESDRSSVFLRLSLKSPGVQTRLHMSLNRSSISSSGALIRRQACCWVRGCRMDIWGPQPSDWSLGKTDNKERGRSKAKTLEIAPMQNRGR